MATAKPNEEHGTVPEVDYAELLRALTVERFTVWKPPSSATDRAAPLSHPRTTFALVDTLDVPNVDVPKVRGRVHDGKNGSKPGRSQ